MGSTDRHRLTRRLGRITCAWVCALPIAGPSMAADAPPSTTVTGVTVVAGPRPPTPTPTLIHQYVRSHGFAGPRIDQLSRWNDPVCPVAIGLDPAFNAFVVKRVTEVAASIGAPTPTTQSCTPNIEIIFTPNPQGLLDGVRKHAPRLLGFHWHADAKSLATVKHPVQAWYATATASGSGEDFLDDSCCSMPSGALGSRFTNGYVSHFKGVLVVADAGKVAGYKIGSIADYVALIALSRPGAPDQCQPLPSITDLMSPACGDDPVRQSLTEADRAYLKALYAADLTRVMQLENVEIEARMKADSGKP